MRQVDQGTPAGDRQEDGRRSFVQGQLDKVDRVAHRLDRATEVDPADQGEATPQRLPEQGRGQGDQYTDPELLAAPRRVERAELHRELVLARVPVPYQLARPRVQVLLRDPHALPE